MSVKVRRDQHVALTRVLRPRSLWRLAVVAFYAAFAVCYCREHHADAIALQLTSAVWQPLKARAQASLLRLPLPA
jgi:hypothetical protein